MRTDTINSLPVNLAMQPGLQVVSACLVRMAVLGAATKCNRAAAMTQKRNYWPALDHDRTWIYGQYVVSLK